MSGMDPAAAIEGLRTAVDRSRTETNEAIERLRTDLTGRMDQMVTRREHEAEVRRLDSENRALSAALVAHAKTSEDTHVDIDKRISNVTGRLTPLEHQIAKLLGIGLVVSIVISAAVAIVAAYIQKG